MIIPRPGDRVLVIATVIEVVDASQTIDFTVRFGDGGIAHLTDADLAHHEGEIFVQRQSQ